eukprot:TRINITY_DN2109_c0_g1_i1.p1 TRINITY_DN2109_c0_g1~~TRINITY_DN2109_c0_g1_i1.p1  ORF type:complete len:293 (+),score=38.45 TRINITY_DN2109_c0_g1_i1:182-1060(+)
MEGFETSYLLPATSNASTSPFGNLQAHIANFHASLQAAAALSSNAGPITFTTGTDGITQCTQSASFDNLSPTQSACQDNILFDFTKLPTQVSPSTLPADSYVGSWTVPDAVPATASPAPSNAVGAATASFSQQTEGMQGYFDVTPFITLSQERAAKRLGIPKSTLSKRWREATCNRKWPFRQLCKIDREIKTLLHNLQGGTVNAQLQSNLATLMRQRQDESRIVFIKNINAPAIKTTPTGALLAPCDSQSESSTKFEPAASSGGMWNETLVATLTGQLTGDVLRNLTAQHSE